MMRSVRFRQGAILLSVFASLLNWAISRRILPTPCPNPSIRRRARLAVGDDTIIAFGAVYLLLHFSGSDVVLVDRQNLIAPFIGQIEAPAVVESL